MNTIQRSGLSRPQLYEIKDNCGTKQLTINFDVEKDATFDGSDGDVWTWNAAVFTPGSFDYAEIVDTIIQHEYPYRRMEAIRNNHDIGTHIEEWEEMQAFRREAKNLAHEILNVFEQMEQEEE